MTSDATMSEFPPGLMVSAPRSGAGKTTLMLGLLRAFRDAGTTVQPFKCGPDYIDTAFHGHAAGRSSCNLDSWAMNEALLSNLAARSTGADLVLAEGSMGLFDGVAQKGAFGNGASADIAVAMGWPVVLVLDVSGQAQSAAAMALGFATYRKELNLAGVILNQVASPRHEALACTGMDAVGIKVLGALPRRKDLELPERHLGLVQSEETTDLESRIDALKMFVCDHVDLATLQAAATAQSVAPDTSALPTPPGQRIALARDAAFSFVYPHLLDAWRKQGVEIVPFSPLADEAPDDTADVAWLPGGYPELHAGKIAAAETFKRGLAKFAETRPVHGECGGYMVLGTGLVDADGTRHAMTGLLGLVTSYEKRKMHLGYRQAELLKPAAGLDAQAKLRGHEFHYSTILEQPDPELARVTDANGAAVAETGSRRGNVTGTFFHLIAEAQ